MYVDGGIDSIDSMEIITDRQERMSLLVEYNAQEKEDDAQLIQTSVE